MCIRDRYISNIITPKAITGSPVNVDWQRLDVGLILMPEPQKVQETSNQWSIGIDFGTSNSCVYYKENKEEPKSLNFKDRIGFLDLGIGILTYSNKFWAGASVFNVLEPNISFSNSEENISLEESFNEKKSDKSITRSFLKGTLSKSLKSTLSNYLSNVKYPIAVRSSSLLEDSQYQPLAGMYSTYMLPNKDKSKSTRLDELEKAIKLVYASTFLNEPKTLIDASVHHHEEEKMAVIIMELVGKHMLILFIRV